MASYDFNGTLDANEGGVPILVAVVYDGAFIPSAVPEPGTSALMGGGQLLLAARRRRATVRR